METKTHLLSEKERWKSRGSDKPKGERLSARKECKAKMAMEIRESTWPPVKQSKKVMGDFGFRRENLEREILKCRFGLNPQNGKADAGRPRRLFRHASKERPRQEERS
ncbi:hypothetical protein K438DRAFT_1774174 [Mycena galopus ATCC 62051]|nr:hypothetical protein K438DRAFT_1774174 [Mycena galopus ATCC 62051]